MPFGGNPAAANLSSAQMRRAQHRSPLPKMTLHFTSASLAENPWRLSSLVSALFQASLPGTTSGTAAAVSLLPAAPPADIVGAAADGTNACCPGCMAAAPRARQSTLAWQLLLLFAAAAAAGAAASWSSLVERTGGCPCTPAPRVLLLRL